VLAATTCRGLPQLHLLNSWVEASLSRRVLSVFTNMNNRTKADSEIDELYQAWGEAFQSKNVDAILGLLTPDYVLWPAGAAAMSRDSLFPRLVATLKSYDITPSFEREERLIVGDFAFERGWDIQQVRSRTGGEVMTHRQRVFLVLRRGDDGRWRFARGMSQPGPAA
jgi:ketosteroid isomerase-like protein